MPTTRLKTIRTRSRNHAFTPVFRMTDVSTGRLWLMPSIRATVVTSLDERWRGVRTARAA